MDEGNRGITCIDTHTSGKEGEMVAEIRKPDLEVGDIFSQRSHWQQLWFVCSISSRF